MNSKSSLVYGPYLPWRPTVVRAGVIDGVIGFVVVGVAVFPGPDPSLTISFKVSPNNLFVLWIYYSNPNPSYFWDVFTKIVLRSDDPSVFLELEYEALWWLETPLEIILLSSVRVDLLFYAFRKLAVSTTSVLKTWSTSSYSLAGVDKLGIQFKWSFDYVSLPLKNILVF